MNGLEDHVYHVFWVNDGKLKDKIEGQKDGTLSMNYRRVSVPKHLQNVLKKYIGEPEDVDAAIKNDRLRVVLGIEINPSGVLQPREMAL